jgi:hypothetical protein
MSDSSSYKADVFDSREEFDDLPGAVSDVIEGAKASENRNLLVAAIEGFFKVCDAPPDNSMKDFPPHIIASLRLRAAMERITNHFVKNSLDEVLWTMLLESAFFPRVIRELRASRSHLHRQPI